MPKTVGTEIYNLRSFSISDIDLDTCNNEQQELIESGFKKFNAKKIQIWGIPSGAFRFCRKMKEHDLVLLAPSQGKFGRFRYCGQVLFLFGEPNYKLSRYFWQSENFPLIFAMEGYFIDNSYIQFLNDVAYSEDYL